MLKSKIKSWFKRIVKAEIASYAASRIYNGYNSVGINFLDNSSFIDSPVCIDGGNKIKIGSKTRIGKNAWLSAYDFYAGQKFTPEIIIGNNVTIGSHCCITSINSVKIEDGCLFSEYIYISDHSHGTDPLSMEPPALQPLFSKGPVVVGKNSFLGFRVCILPGVSLGEHCVVGSNSVVTKSFPAFSMIGGVPAKLLKYFDFEKKVWVAGER